MAFSRNRERLARKETGLFAEEKAKAEYLATLREASVADYAVHFVEEGAIRSNRDYSHWTLNAEDCDLLLKSLLQSTTSESDENVTPPWVKRRLV